MTTPQYRLVYGIARKLGYDNDVLHALVKDLFNKTSLRALREDEAHKLINRLKRLAGQPVEPGYRTPGMTVDDKGTTSEYCSPAQAYMIRYLCRALGVNQTRLWGIIHTRFGLRRHMHTLDNLRHPDAEKLILQLKTEREEKKQRAKLAARQTDLSL